MARGGEKQLVLDFGKELQRFCLIAPVVAGKSEQIAHLLVEALLRGPDIADAGKQFVKVVGTAIGILQPLVVHREALDEILA